MTANETLQLWAGWATGDTCSNFQYNDTGLTAGCYQTNVGQTISCANMMTSAI